MLGKFSEQIQVNAPTSEVWNLYGTFKLPNLVVEKLPHIVEKVELIERNGGAGSLLKVSLVGNAPYKEKYVLVGDEKRVKEVEIVEGGFLDLGFKFFLIKWEILENDENSSIIKLTIDFETKDVEKIHLTNGLFQVLVALMKASVDYLEK
ncbi:norbelladine synthase-like isoform X2 [Solanum dulcamara]|uniref:norbelladine synthase-like isoform X2 n=1 Tax=Solanum dulcamara TaxID=45834 RepID=UPI00248642BA|nr:norbelladine synthase-like isoform X2 [Solanum dulcamara]